MKLSKQHQLYLGILGVAALGLIADRTVFKPSEAVASTDEYLVEESEDGDDGVLPNTAAASGHSVAKRLQQFGQERQVNPLSVANVFHPAWRPVATAPTTAPVKNPTQDGAETFMQKHRLTAVMGANRSGASAYAIVDGKLLRIGQAQDGWTLVSVGSRSAVFESNGVSAELHVDADQRSNGPSTSEGGGATPAAPDNAPPLLENQESHRD